MSKIGAVMRYLFSSESDKTRCQETSTAEEKEQIQREADEVAARLRVIQNEIDVRVARIARDQS